MGLTCAHFAADDASEVHTGRHDDERCLSQSCAAAKRDLSVALEETWQMIQQLKQRALTKSAENRRLAFMGCFWNGQEQSQVLAAGLRYNRDEVVTSFQTPAGLLRVLLQACIDDWCCQEGVQGRLRPSLCLKAY